jgi:E3 SUMO-protein ligase RanBP2
MASGDRVAALRGMLEKSPGDVRIRFGLAAEHEKRGEWTHVVDELRAYLAAADDQGNAWGRLGQALRRLGRDDEARDAYRAGADAARRHGHPSMAAEFEETLEDWE